jgi:hypothetical protein
MKFSSGSHYCPFGLLDKLSNIYIPTIITHCVLNGIPTEVEQCFRGLCFNGKQLFFVSVKNNFIALSNFNV